MNNKRYQVFVSSTYEDLKETRGKVIDALMAINAIPAGMETFPSASDDAWTIIKQAIDLSDYYIVIIGGKYGSIDPKTGLSYTEMEYDYAGEVGIPRMAFIHGNPEDLKAKNVEIKTKARNKLETFKRKVKKKICKFWRNEQELITNVLASYAQECSRKPGIGWVRGNEAKTIEDAERRAFLERKVQELEKDIVRFNSAELEYKRLYEESQRNLKITIYINDEQQAVLFPSYIKLFFSLGMDLLNKRSVDTSYPHDMQYVVYWSLDFITDHKYDKCKNVSIDYTQHSRFIEFLLLRGLVELTIVSVEQDEDNPEPGQTRSYLELTNKGKEYLLYIARKFNEQREFKNTSCEDNINQTSCS